MGKACIEMYVYIHVDIRETHSFTILGSLSYSSDGQESASPKLWQWCHRTWNLFRWIEHGVRCLRWWRVEVTGTVCGHSASLGTTDSGSRALRLQWGMLVCVFTDFCVDFHLSKEYNSAVAVTVTCGSYSCLDSVHLLVSWNIVHIHCFFRITLGPRAATSAWWISAKLHMLLDWNVPYFGN